MEGGLRSTVNMRMGMHDANAGMEEYWDYIFPEEAGAAPHLKLLELAYKHKRQKMDTGGL
eukprot:1157757-Pelagomonas_calceolata.AAC.23